MCFGSPSESNHIMIGQQLQTRSITFLYNIYNTNLNHVVLIVHSCSGANPVFYWYGPGVVIFEHDKCDAIV